MGFLLDCSHYQGTINWSQVANDGCLGAYVKVTDGASGVDAMWQTNHAGATGVGLPVGPYHFAEGGNVSAEAAHFASVWSAGWSLHPVLDYEIASANAGWLTAFRSYFRQDTGFQPFRVYTSQSLLEGALNPANWIDADTTIWAARYAAALGWIHAALVLWQNTSAAKVAGILGSVDEDQFQNGWTPGADMAMSQADANLFVSTLMGAVVPGSNGQQFGALVGMIGSQFDVTALAAGGMTVPDRLSEIDTEVQALDASESTDQGTLTNIFTAVKGIQSGNVDPAELATALVPLLAPADAQAFLAAFKAQLAK